MGRMVSTLVIALTVALAGPAHADGASPPPPAQITWSGNFETGDIGQFAGNPPQCFTQNDSTCQAVSSPVRQGAFSGKFTTNATDRPPTTQRAMVFGYPPGEQDGSESYYAMAMMFPTGFTTPSWMDFMDFGHRDHELRGCVMAELVASYDDAPPAHQIFLHLCTGVIGSTLAHRQFKIQDGLNIGQWNEYVLHIRWRHDSAGLFEIWRRVQGESVWRKALTFNGPTTYYDPSWSAPVVLGFEYGMYRSGDLGGPQSIYHDGLVRGSTFDAVVQAAFG
jgi:hypothetical protein